MCFARNKNIEHVRLLFANIPAQASNKINVSWGMIYEKMTEVQSDKRAFYWEKGNSKFKIV